MRKTWIQSAAAAAGALTVTMVIAASAGPPTGENEPGVSPDLAEKMARGGEGGRNGERELPPFDKVVKDYTKVVSTADGQASLYTIYTREKDAQMLAELPRNFDTQRLFIAYTIAGGTMTAGVQSGDTYAQWKRFDNRLALIEPNVEVRTSGDLESRKGYGRVFTNRVILDIPIAAEGPGGGPVIDMDDLLLGQASKFLGRTAQGANVPLSRIVKAKAFPQNVEMAFELPMASGRFATFHYSISVLPENTGYKPRVADERIGYFTTTHRDIGNPGADTPWVRYVNRWKLERADPKLKLSPPKDPIVFYLEHTIPVRYRRWVRDGVLEWNKAYEKIGIVNAIEVYQQDARTNAHMEKDPEDARYNFVLWTNANMGFAIGPSRVDPNTGQILDADIVMDEGFITSWVKTWQRLIPEVAMQGFGPETLAWLQSRPKWDPRVRLADLSRRQDVIRTLAAQSAVAGPYAGHPAANADPTLLGDDAYDGLTRVSQVNGACLHAIGRSADVAMFRLSPDLFNELAMGAEDDAAGDEGGAEGDKPKDEKKDEQLLDGVPEEFIGPLLKDVVMHEVGHTLGLRHNFKASTVYTLEEINDAAFRGKPQTGSVMDYNPVNINFKDGPVQGDWTMVTIGPYDEWAIEYGYTAESDLKPILSRVAEPGLSYATDEDTWGPDPRARRFDYAQNPLSFADSQMRLVKYLRGRILDKMVKDGESWSKARQAYEVLLFKHFGAAAIAVNWVGGSYVNRDKKGDPGARSPIENIPPDQQRRALKFVIENVFADDAYGLSPELLSKMTVDKWWDAGGMDEIFQDPTYPVHARILGIQASVLTMMMNPTTLNRVYDNEFRMNGDGAVTLPEVLNGVADAIWSELDQPREPGSKAMISSLRRNLQREHLERLIDLCMPNDSFGPAAKPVANLSCYKLREISGRIGKALERVDAKADPYTVAHLTEAKVRIDKALDAQYIYNTDDISAGQAPMFFGSGTP